ncbi:SRPBCC family protein [Actinomycetospora cinnamomea]|uniref:Polyketide cyclase/dehydrase/lipid transport protein n=1 Tax=Actinomycetospora cinnamomea TaxID=663609 RepID=A0A2U1FRL5_9PSEU|nr:SRPBCC family protein [Actinomycetospora cinnamomea]PVZ14815.1 polyketide cyclase/dehydrase/lipid transport protein [Actinomycetospora cinnamomea]
MEYTVSRDVGVDAGTVWAVIADVERMPTWTSTMTRVRLLDGGPLRVGARVRVEQPWLPPATWEVTELEPGRSFTWAAPAPGLRSVAWHAVEPLGESRSRVTLGIRQSGPLGLVATLAGPLTRRYVDTEIAGLVRAAVEAAGGS